MLHLAVYMTTFSDHDCTETEALVDLKKVTVAVKLLESACGVKDAVKKLKNHPVRALVYTGEYLYFNIFIRLLLWLKFHFHFLMKGRTIRDANVS